MGRDVRSRIEEKEGNGAISRLFYTTIVKHTQCVQTVKKLLVYGWTCIRIRLFVYTLTHERVHTMLSLIGMLIHHDLHQQCGSEGNLGANVIEYSERLCVERGPREQREAEERSTHTSNQGTWEIDYNVRGTRSWHAVTFDVIYSCEGTACLYSSCRIYWPNNE